MSEIQLRVTIETFEQEHGVVFMQHYAEIPAVQLEAAGLKVGQRVIGHLGRAPFRLCIHHRPAHQLFFLMVGKHLLKEAGLRPGEQTTLTLMADPDPDRIDIPEELEVALQLEPGAWDKWQALTPGMQRSYIVYINQAKRSETKVNRSIDFARKLAHGLLRSQAK